jgi:RNA polymerase sigma factor for flagellar operon FliA
MAELEQRWGRLPADDEVAAVLELSLEEYHDLLEKIRPATFICLDSSSLMDGNDDRTEHDALADPNQRNPRDAVSKAELAVLIAQRIEQLPDFYKKVMALYYEEGLRVSEIAQVTGFCPAHICQTHSKAILAIRAYLEKHEGARRKSSIVNRQS